ncbi:hypothetical protein GcM1_188013 [Golovinomyces cichoracearum]|uniref:Uncharacterized protein n=1 Tax=Golovinomyces cichoracearum TaxID=62708 RepID=A0A420J284_9PEZI|nr:hypothetical protein GcM1_188013 [Golovinomyces cichoracearum]
MILEPLNQWPTRLSSLQTIANIHTHASFDDDKNAPSKHAQTEQFGYKFKDQNKNRVYLHCCENNSQRISTST